MDPNVDKPPPYYPSPPPVNLGDGMQYPGMSPGMPQFGQEPLLVTCDNCGERVVTKVERQNGTCAGLAGFLLFFVCLPFFWVPLVIDDCKDYYHFCPSCNVVLGINKMI